MNNIILSPRLAAAAEFAGGGTNIVDVGTDHGYLPVWFALNKPKTVVTATDIHAMPLERARRSAREYGVSDGAIRFVLCDGLDFSGAEHADTVIIAGMGGDTIVSVLSRAEWTKNGVNIVLQPQSKLDRLCVWLAENGYSPTLAVLVRDEGRLYTVLKVCGVPSVARLPVYAEDCLLRCRDPLLHEWLDRRISVLEAAEAGMLRSENTDNTAIISARAELIRLRSAKGEADKWQL